MRLHRPLVGLALGVLAIVAWSATSYAQASREQVTVVTLPDARERALSVNPASVAARGNVDVAAWQRRSAITDLITPNVSASSSYASFSDPFINPGTGSISAQAISLADRPQRAIWVTSVRTRREDRSSISSDPLADLGG